jgi:hypothetical protein
MTHAVPLPGLDRLIEVCRKHSLPLRLAPPFQSAPAAGEDFQGLPFDPVLAAVYRRVGSARLGDFAIVRSEASSPYGIDTFNKGAKGDDEEPFRSCILFGMVPNLAYSFATVPRLADAQAIQPVVYIDAYEEPFVLPVASSVDRFFDTYSRYLEQVVHAEDYEPSRFSGVHFPFTVPELIARDRPLVERVRAGHFDFLMLPDEQTREWVEKFLAASP